METVLGTIETRQRVPAGRRAMECLSVLVLVFGGVLRLRQYLANPALWLDELQLSLNVVHRTFRGLTHPLDSHQAAPVGWLWLEKLATERLGSGELGLRFVPMLLSLGALVLFFLLARRYLVGIALVVVCTLFALSPVLINYAAQTKQYGTDVFFVLSVLLLAERVEEKSSRLRLVAWVVGSILAMWCSHGATITLAAVTVVLLCRSVSRLRARAIDPFALRAIIAGALLFGVSFVLEYETNLKSISRDPVLISSWRRGSPPEPFGPGGAASWLWHAANFLMTNPFAFTASRVALAMIGIGAVVLVVERGSVAMLIVAPIVASVILALAGRYPLHERLSLYLAPCVYLLIAAIIDTRVWRGRTAFAAFGLAALLLVAPRPVYRAVSVAWRPTVVTDSRGPFAFVASHWRAGDELYVESPWAMPAYRYYGPRYGLQLAGTFDLRKGAEPCVVDAQLHGLLGARRVWFVVTHRASREPVTRNAIYLRYFDRVGHQRSSFHGAGDAAAFLYVPDRAPSAITGAGWFPHACLSVNPVVVPHLPAPHP